MTNPFDIASAFNDYFIELNNNNVSTENTQGPKAKITTVSNSMFLRPMAKEEVEKEILSLKNTTSEGFDGVSTKVIKACVDELAPIMTHLINLSFACGIFPELLKVSVVKPLYKKGERNDISNYRPITLISILSNIFEKCI